MQNPVSILYIVRHAECLHNKVKIFLPPDEDILTEHGKVQAGLLGDHLKDIKFTKVFSSDYPRSIETVACILAKSTHPTVGNLKVQLDERIRERNVGIYEGGPAEPVLKYLAECIFEKGIPATEVEFPGGDTSAVMFGRVQAFFQDILHNVDNSEDGEIILVTSHGSFIHFLMHYLQSSKDKFELANATDVLSKYAPNTGVVKLGIHRKRSNDSFRKIDVLAEYDSKHLESLKRNDVLHETTKKTKFEGCVHQ